MPKYLTFNLEIQGCVLYQRRNIVQPGFLTPVVQIFPVTPSMKNISWISYMIMKQISPKKIGGGGSDYFSRNTFLPRQLGVLV